MNISLQKILVLVTINFVTTSKKFVTKEKLSYLFHTKKSVTKSISHKNHNLMSLNIFLVTIFIVIMETILFIVKLTYMPS